MEDMHLDPHSRIQSPYVPHNASDSPRVDSEERKKRFDKQMVLESFRQQRDPMLDAPASSSSAPHRAVGFCPGLQ